MLKTPKILGVIVVTNESVGLHVQNLRPGWRYIIRPLCGL